MATRQLRSIARPASAATLRQVATDAGRSLPPAKVKRASPVNGKKPPKVLVNFKVDEDLARQIALAAEAEHITQKVIITRALKKAGFRVDPSDLVDGGGRRRFGR